MSTALHSGFSKFRGISSSSNKPRSSLRSTAWKDRGWLKAEWKVTETGREGKLADWGQNMRWYRRFFQRAQSEKRLDAELRFHLEQQIADYVATGMTPEEARHRARLEFGGLDQVKEECRDVGAGRFVESLIQDVRYGLRQLRRNPGFTAVAVITLALGIGATTAIFSVVNGVLFSPLPFPRPGRLVILRESSSNFPELSVSYVNFRDWQRQQRSFSGLAIYRDFGQFNLAERGGAVAIPGAMVSAGFFKTLGISPLLGRTFSVQDDRLGTGRTAILSYQFWQRRFGADRAILGKSINLDGKDYIVIGVLPNDFWFFPPEDDVYVPVGVFNQMWRTDRQMHYGFSAVGRLKPGVTLAQAQSDMSGIERRLDSEYPKDDVGLGVALASMPHDVVQDVSRMLYLLLGAVCLVLLIACVNVANLLLSRSTTREKEMGIRAALGAGRKRVIRQLLTESVLLASAGGALGILIAVWGTSGLLTYVPQELPRSRNVGVDFTVLVFAVALSALTGLLFGLAPAFRSSSTDLRESLQESSRGTSRGRHGLQNGLVVAEVGLALVLLVGAGLTLRTILHLYRVKTGFATSGALVFGVSLPASRYHSGPADRAFYRDLTARIGNLPGVRAVGATQIMPMSGADNENPFYIQGQPKPQPQNMAWAMSYVTTPGYASAMGITLLRGRPFTDQDTLRSRPVVLIDDELAQKVFPGQDPLGQDIVIFGAPREIVGILRHIKHYGPVGKKWTQNLEGAIYMPFAQIPDAALASGGPADLTLVVRTAVNPQSMIPSIKHAIHRIDNGVALTDVRTMNDLLRLDLAGQRLTALLFGIYAALALILAAIGIYGVISYAVARRTHEIGIRMALGARQRDVLLHVIWHGMMLASAGLAAGVIVSLFATRLLANLLFGVSPTDPFTFVVVSVMLAAVALLACYIPARRAAKVDPMIALRHE
jgi:predicted permease